MTIFSVFIFLGGLAFFLFGMKLMGNSLEKLSGGKMEKTLGKLTNNLLKGVLLGAGVTALIQSSSATTVMVVGFVNSGIMNLQQAVGVIMGANVGTTATSWILSLVGVSGDNLILNLLKPSNFSPLVAFIGVLMTMLCKRAKPKELGYIFFGFGILMYGMTMMSSSVEPLAEENWFKNLFTIFTNPVLGLIAGAILTAVMQSSTASVGVLQAVSATGIITFGSAFPIVLGQNIGTCITTLFSCIGAKKNAKRAAFIHLYFNIIGAALLLILYYGLISAFNVDTSLIPVNTVTIALIHTAFNLVSVVFLLPFNKLLVRFAELTIKESTELPEVYIDERFLATPAVAVARCHGVTRDMMSLAEKMIQMAFGTIDEKTYEDVKEMERKTDVYEDTLNSYLINLSNKNLNPRDNRSVTAMFHHSSDIERIADYGMSIAKLVNEKNNNQVDFSPEGNREIEEIKKIVLEMLKETSLVLADKPLFYTGKINAMEKKIKELRQKSRTNHVQRLKEKKCSKNSGIYFVDYLTFLERISAICVNICSNASEKTVAL
ncbi:MAG: Na/Pi cotransporter family protein [Oscillospiraceae bacterium]|nr:Na/Pi cotransporter family protein [Oscillospiraceae bacterium]